MRLRRGNAKLRDYDCVDGRMPTILGIIGVVSGVVGTIIAVLAFVFYVTQAQVSTAKITYPIALRNPGDCTFLTTREGFQLSGKATLLTGRHFGSYLVRLIRPLHHVEAAGCYFVWPLVSQPE